VFNSTAPERNFNHFFIPMMNIIEHYFRKRIDDALDNAQPLDGLTSWYVRRSPKLWAYYAEMLELELELRFPDTELPSNCPNNYSSNNYPSNNYPGNYPENCSKNCSKNLTSPNNLNYRARSLFGNRIGMSAAIIILAFLTVFSLFKFLKLQPLPEQHEIVSNNPNSSTEVQKSTDEQKIDLGDIWGELSFTAVPLTELVPPIETPFENPFENTLLKFPVEPIVRFTDHPLETTLTILETAGIVRTSNHERD
jgi:hypothetical protein